MRYATPAIREARRQCREERMRQGLDRHITNPAEVAERARVFAALTQWMDRQDATKAAEAARALRAQAVGR